MLVIHWCSVKFLCFWLIFFLTEQHFFEKVKQLNECQDGFLSKTQEHLKLKEEFTKLGKSDE